MVSENISKARANQFECPLGDIDERSGESGSPIKAREFKLSGACLEEAQ